MSGRHPFLPDPGMPVVLASASPRRSDILNAQGLSFTVVPAHIDEGALPDEAPGPHVERLALEKARAVARDFPEALVLGFDTIVVIDEIGKMECFCELFMALMRRPSSFRAKAADSPTRASSSEFVIPSLSLDRTRSPASHPLPGPLS